MSRDSWGIEKTYEDAAGKLQEVSDDAVAAIQKAVTTHDLPTLVGVWTGADLETQRHIGIKPDRAGSDLFQRKLLETSGLKPDADVIPASNMLRAVHSGT